MKMSEEVGIVVLAISHVLVRFRFKQFCVSLDVERFLGKPRLTLRVVPLTPNGDDVKVKSISIPIPPKLCEILSRIPTLDILI